MRHPCFAFVAIAIAATSSLAAQPATPSASASPTSGACASASDPPAYFADAFNYDLESPAVLHFTSLLAALPEDRQKPLFDAGVAAADTAAEKHAQTAEAALCPSVEGTYGATRVGNFMVSTWKLKDVTDLGRFQKFYTALATAMLATSLGDRLDADDRTAALEPFAAVLAAATPVPDPVVSPPCVDAGVKVLQLRPPHFPAADAGSVAGTIEVRVSVSDTGDVRDVRLSSDSLHSADASDPLVDAVIFAAAATTYAPATKNCIPVPGTYLYKADVTPLK
jgi:hypothetical protein